MIEWLFSSGRIIDIALAITVLEALGLFIFHRVTGRGPGPLDVLLILSSGVFLMLAIRAALVDAQWTMIALPLLCAFASHLIDLSRRWSR